MAERQKRTARPRRLKESEVVPAPYNHVYGPRDPDEDRLVTTLTLAGEALAKALTPRAPLPHADAEETVPHARPVENPRPVVFEEFEGLLELCGRIRAWVELDARHVELLDSLRQAFGDGDILRVLFRNLFPDQPARSSRDKSGSPVLTPAEVTVLREAAKDLSQAKIAANLGIARRTVGTHLHRVYKKLGVQRRLQAVARAISMGYLPFDALDFVTSASHCAARNFSAFDSFVSSDLGGFAEILGTTGLTSLAQFGLLLMIVGGAAAAPFYYVRFEPQRGGVWELDAQGRIVRAFGDDWLHDPYSLALAPAEAALHGFTPGRLFVLDAFRPQQGLNKAAVAEFNLNGQLVHAFCGGRDLATRINHSCLAFARDGRLLVGTGDGLLAFSDGGASVVRLANGNCQQIAVDADGCIFVAQNSTVGCVVKVLDSAGHLLRTIGGRV